MKKLLKTPLLPLIFSAITTSIICYFINQLPGIPDFPYKTEMLVACVFIFTILSALVAYWQAKQEIQGVPAEIDPTLRPRLLEAEATKVKERLHDSLHNLLMLDLMREEQPQQVGRKPLQTFYTLSANNITTQPKILDKMVAVLRRGDIGGRLLILGQPGGGKTTTLLNLAEELNDLAKLDDKEPIPVIFELSAWRDDSVSILDWLILQLKKEYKSNLPPRISRLLLERGKILPLLDGLDELGLEKQRKCIRAINQYLAEDATRDLVVCCRKEEYLAGEEQLSELKGAVCLEKLLDEQIRDYLNQLQRGDLWQSIQNNTDFFELARTPLLLSIMVIAYQGRAIQTKEELFDAYIERRFELLPVGKGEPPRRKIMYFLVFLAKQLRETQTEFLIENIQPYWLQNFHNKLIFGLTSWLISGLIFGLILGLISRQISALVQGLISGLIFGLMSGLIFRPLSERLFEQNFLQIFMRNMRLLFKPLFNLNINTLEEIRFDFTFITLKDFIKNFLFGMIFGLTFGMILAPILGLILGLIFGLYLGLYLGLYFGLIFGLNKSIVNKSFPNQGIWASLKNAFILTIVLFISLLFLSEQILLKGLLLQFIAANEASRIIALSQFLIIFVTFFWGGGFDCVQHFSLRLVLFYNGYIPWNYAKFLGYAAKRRLIQQVGGRYRFIHRLLLEHFADMWV